MTLAPRLRHLRPCRKKDQLPVEVVRDLLGIARAMYAAFETMGPEYADHMFRLRGIGFQLQLALDKAAMGGNGTFAMRSAWLISEEAAKNLGKLVDEHMPAQLLVKPTGERLARKNRP